MKHILFAFFGVLITVTVLIILYSFYKRITPDIVIRSGPAVIKELKSLNRYETASFTIEKIIDAGISESELGQFLFGDKILLIAHGEAVAGFDFSQISENDIEVRQDTIILTLPEPQVLSVRLDSKKTRVYDRQLGILTHGDKDLETKARNEAEKSIRQAACEGNILNEASKNGKAQLTALLRAFGFVEVTIHIPQAVCR